MPKNKPFIYYACLTEEELKFYQSCNRKYGDLVNKSASDIQGAINELASVDDYKTILTDLVKYLDLRLRITVG